MELSPELYTVIFFGSLIVLLVLGLPLCFILGGIGLVATLLFWGPDQLFVVATRTWHMMNILVFSCTALFIFMGAMLERAGIANDLYEMMYRWVGSVSGGLAIATVLACTVMAAMVGVSSAATVTMGLVSLPAMLKRGYDKRIAIGSISAGGSLGILIPPSIIMIVYALFAQESVGQLFLGGVFAGLLLSSLFCVYIFVRCRFQRDLAPTLTKEERPSWAEKFISLRAIILPVFLVMGVIGSIFLGVASPTEAAAIGGLGSIICAAVYRKLTPTVLKDACYRTIRLTAMVMFIGLGGMLFTTVYQVLNAGQVVEHILLALPGGAWISLIAMQLILLLLGTMLDPVAIIMLTVPLFVPIVSSLGFDTVWFGVLFTINMEMGYITPPFGYNLFYMKSIVPEGITMGDIYRSVIPFFLLEVVGLVVLMLFPEIILYLPKQMIRR